MDHKLPRLPRTTRKQCPKNSRIQPPLQRRKRHLRKRRKFLLLCTLHLPRTHYSRTTTARSNRPVVLGQTCSVHGDDAANAAREHALPLGFGNLFAVVCAGGGFGGPFLLEEGAVVGAGVAEALEVIKVVFAP